MGCCVVESVLQGHATVATSRSALAFLQAPGEKCYAAYLLQAVSQLVLQEDVLVAGGGFMRDAAVRNELLSLLYGQCEGGSSMVEPKGRVCVIFRAHPLRGCGEEHVEDGCERFFSLRTSFLPAKVRRSASSAYLIPLQLSC